jgi:hypothetical protein
VRTGNLYDAKDGNFYEKLIDGADVESGSGLIVVTESPVSMGVEEGNGINVKLVADGEMIPPTQPVIEFGEREGTDSEVVANGSIQLKS